MDPARDIQTPPHSIEAEQGLLGSIIQQPAYAIPIALRKITVAYLFVPAHQIIFERATELYNDQGMFDLITLTQYLRDVGQITAVGGPGYVTELSTFVPTAANIDYYLDIVRNKYVLRRFIQANTEGVRTAYENQDDITEVIAQHEKRMEMVRLAAQPGHLRLPSLCDMSKFIGVYLPAEPPELVQHVLHQGSKLIVGGTSKGRKTMALIDLAVSVASGTNWWGFPSVKGPVCYINFEIQDAFFAKRVNAVCQAKRLSLSRIC